ncbi:SURF1 family protein [Devosia sp.]|uniref:SURF1 family protein n=1 Tax=Devosia sp. TaxID=1871048 RepID=UPI0037BEEEF5
MNRWLKLAFVVLMLGLTASFAGLGYWQIERLAEKERLIASVAAGLNSAPAPLAEAADYRPVTVSGSYIPGSTVLVFTSLGEDAGGISGPGYWVMTALAVDAGGSLYINRGFVPQARGAEFAAAPPPTGLQTLSGIARAAEPGGSFTPAADIKNRIDWIRDPQRLAAFAGDLPQPLSNFYLDLPAGPPGTLPQGGETVVEFPNNHLGYAITWFGFAFLTPILLGFWLVGQRKKTAPL